MGKFDGYLICTDLDGTFSVGHEICGENLKYVKYFQENGGLFTVTTGRLPEHIKNYEGFTPNCPVITHNGSMIYDLEKDEVLYKAVLPNTIYDVIDYASKCEGIRDMWLNGQDNFIKVPCSDIENENLKLVICTENEDATTRLREELGKKYEDEYSIFLGWSLGLEFLPKGANKGSAVEKLKEILGDKVKKVICVGDSESDTFMLKCADIGYAVENASDEAKQAADRITVHYKEGAIAQIIKDIENELLKKRV